MKLFYILFTLLVLQFSEAFSKEVEVLLGPSYANDVWYSFANGVVKTESKDNWDIAFQVGQKAGIWINSQKGVQLWAVPNSSVDSWGKAVDTTGLSSTWTALNNSVDTWDIGAFNMGKDGYATNGDFGWGYYDMGDTHYTLGDKVFVIKLKDGSFKQIFIDGLKSRVYYFKWADLNGANEMNDSLSKNNYTSKNFGYFDLTAKKAIDREPESSAWDLQFGKYMGMVSDNDGKLTPYNVTGVRINNKLSVARVSGIDKNKSTAPELNLTNYITKITAIGDDWKKFDMNTYNYNMIDSLSYFITKTANVSTTASNVVIDKIYFKAFEGSASGRIVFELNPNSSSVDLVAKSDLIYPNVVGVGENVNIKLAAGNVSVQSLRLVNSIGSEVASIEKISANNGFSMPSVAAGAYLLEVRADNGVKYFNIIVK
jgi:hypothetical protein